MERKSDVKIGCISKLAALIITKKSSIVIACISMKVYVWTARLEDIALVEGGKNG